MSITLKEEPIYFGITTDSSFYILKDGEKIGEGGVSKMESVTEITDTDMLWLEWVELYPTFRGQSLFRSVLLSICDYFNVTALFLESSMDNVDMYNYLGAVKGEYDDFRDMQAFTLQKETLIKGKNKLWIIF